MAHQKQLEVEEGEVQLLLAKDIAEGEVVKREEEKKDKKQTKYPKAYVVLEVAEQLVTADYLVDPLFCFLPPLDYPQSSHV